MVTAKKIAPEKKKITQSGIITKPGKKITAKTAISKNATEKPVFIPKPTKTDMEEKPKLRGSLADSISKNKLQEKEEPKKSGPTRI